ncbi:MAG: chorismate synthase [Fusobacteriaceae bacterium]|jgi:chorismate synthase|nr:chorismate synthase [Fusobacteriales bacterium]MDN5303700.1 chorismate synthase [Fusobacteriaceae bacterium]
MSANWGKNIKLTIFGESHGPGVGIVIDGLPPGLHIDMEFVRDELERRATGKNMLMTARKEPDAIEILSGYFDYHTTGGPLSLVIKNKDQKSKDYSKLKNWMRPGHADYTGNVKYKGFNDYRGGGHFSARITTPFVVAGAIAKQILAKENIYIGSHIKSIANIEDRDFEEKDLNKNIFSELAKEQLCVLNKEIADKMRDEILNAREELDSVGGIVETAIINLPAGVGEPFFESIESRLASMIFSVPAVKGIEFGKGFGITRLRGSEANDEYYYDEEGNVKTKTNNNAGILGGISNGMPIIFKTALKPTASISKPQKSINIETKKEEEFAITGRHDPCIVPRAVVILESAAALTILDMLIESRRYNGFK